MTTFSDRVARFWRDNTLFTALLELTYRCNLNCSFCYNDLGLAGTPLTLADYLRLLDELRDLGTLHLALSGGEPLAHPEFFAIGAAARERGFAVRVKSNGHALRGRLARRLLDEVDPYLVEVSLHGARGATHDRQTRVPGSFERLIANLEELVGLGLRVRINSTLTVWNEGELEQMFALADRLGLPLHVDPEVTARDDGDRSPLDLAPSRDGIRRLFELQRDRAAGCGIEATMAEPPAALAAFPAARKHCGAGSSHVTIDPFGNVYPCVQWRVPVGNVHQDSLSVIWNSASGLGEVRQLQGEIARRIGELGPHGASVGFCPGIAHQESGSPVELYAAANQRLELRREVAGTGAGHRALRVLP